MLAWLKSIAGRGPETPRHAVSFTGPGVYFMTDVHSVRCDSLSPSPASLIEATTRILTSQSRIIEAQGGTIEQFVGCAILAYRPPMNDLSAALGSAHKAAGLLIRNKTKVPSLDFCLGIRFSAGELAGALFGTGSVQRFQVLGKARDRAGRLPHFQPGSDFVFTDAETFRVMPDEARATFVPMNETTYSLQVG